MRFAVTLQIAGVMVGVAGVDRLFGLGWTLVAGGAALAGVGWIVEQAAHNSGQG